MFIIMDGMVIRVGMAVVWGPPKLARQTSRQLYIIIVVVPNSGGGASW
jgi:hypothetical protein